MSRLGHASPRAALIYQHAAVERDREIADKIGDVLGVPAPTGATVRELRRV